MTASIKSSFESEKKISPGVEVEVGGLHPVYKSPYTKKIRTAFPFLSYVIHENEASVKDFNCLTMFAVFINFIKSRLSDKNLKRQEPDGPT